MNLRRLLFFAVFLVTPLLLHAQSWRYTGKLNTERRLHTIDVLQNGKVLVTGGDNAQGTALSSCEIYDPATESWSYASSMKHGRERHTSHVLPDGRVVVLGGNINNIFSNVVTGSVEIYNPSTDTWTEDGSLNIPRQDHTSTLLNDSLIFVCGGFTGFDGGYTASCEIYNVNSHTSTMTAPMTTVRHEHSAVRLANGTVLIAGGRTGGSSSTYLNDAEVFDPVTNSWTVVGAMGQQRAVGMMALFSDNTVLVAGGRNTENSSAPGTELYNPTTQRWSEVDSIKLPCAWQGGTVLPGDRLLMTGGTVDAEWGDPFGQSAHNTATCEWYDKPNAAWYFAPTMNASRSEHGAVTFTQSTNSNLPYQVVLVAGGIIGTADVTNKCEVLDVGLNALSYYRAHQGEHGLGVRDVNIVGNSLEISYINAPSLKLGLVEADDVELRIASIDGQIVFESRASLPAGISYVSLPSRMSAGMYFAQVKTSRGLLTTKLIITRQ